MLTIAGKNFHNRLILGTGKYKNLAVMKGCFEAAGVDMITLAVRRFDLNEPGEDNILNWIPKTITLMPNTAGCHSREEALRVSRLTREILDTPWIKLEIITDPKSLYPDNEETLLAAKELVSAGFVVLPYMNTDPIMAKKLVDAGCSALMPLASAIGSGLGIQNPYELMLIKEICDTAKIPMIVDAGVGTASDAAVAMELGAEAVLLNSAVAEAHDPIKMAQAMDHAVKAGRLAYEAGRIPKKLYASAHGPIIGVVGKS